ncbi:DoxX family membrane protein, partial [bacterium]|nr:DoxX family membrane protein [bacterium]
MQSWLTLLLRLALGILFLVSGFAKLTELGSFVRTLESLNFLPVEFIPFLRLAVPIVEIILGIMLSGGILIHYATRATLVLLIIFSIVIFTQI